MEKVNFLPLGTRTQGRVVKLNSTKSAKLNMFSTILSFAIETDTALGKTFANRGFFGIMLTEKNPADLLKNGDLVDVQIASYRESEYNGQVNVAAQVSFIAKAEPNIRTQAAQNLSETAESNQGSRQATK